MTWVAVGTAAAVGAGVGGASAAIQGKSGDEILTSALIGGATGAVTGGAGAALSPGATEVGVGLGEALTEEGIKAASEQTMTDALAQEALTPLTEIGAGINPVPPAAGLEQIVPAGADPTFGFSPEELNAVNQGLAEGNASGASPYEQTAALKQTPLVQKAASIPSTGGINAAPSTGIGISPGTAPTPATTINGYTPQELSTNYRPDLSYSTQVGTTAANVPAMPPAPTPPVPETNSFLQGAKDVGKWMDENPFKTGAAAYIGLQQTGAFNQKGASAPPQKTFKNQYSLSPDFEGGPYSEPNIYKPKYAAGGITQINGPVEQMSANALGGDTNMYPQSQQQRTYFATPTQMPASAEVTMDNQYSGVTMAQGGIARYAEGDEVEERPTRRYRGDLMGTLDKYNEMIEGKKSGSLPSGKSDPYTGEVGTFTDSDVDTRLQDAYTASLTRLKKAGKRANVGIAALPAGVQAGALNMPTQQAAGGGIMQASLGGYAAGGNPRLLSGPGDGMSDNIPATISGRQPARLADGEFVVPADVVSHLGNGSTNAGAKKLHGMMNKVRMDRTGKKKQAPAVKAGKYLPK
jgi:hypothetical protein